MPEMPPCGEDCPFYEMAQEPDDYTLDVGAWAKSNGVNRAWVDDLRDRGNE